MTPHEEARKRLMGKWLEKGAKDLAVGTLLLKKGDLYFDFACFHCQQCAEKAVKAFLVWHNIPFRKIHDLVSLGALCLPVDARRS
jgi:HEPN domain-containing protein